MKIISIVLALLIGIGIGNYLNFSANAEEQYVGRALFDIQTGKVIEYQGRAYYENGMLVPLGTLKQNGIAAGLNPANLQEKYVTQLEYETYMASLHTSKQITVAYQQAMIDLNLIINTTNPTNAQVIWAVKRLAEIEKKELQYHRLETELN